MTGGKKLYLAINHAERHLGLRKKDDYGPPYDDIAPIHQKVYELAALVTFDNSDETCKAASQCVCGLDGEELRKRILASMESGQ